MEGLSDAQIWYENNFLLCEASVNLGITKGKFSSQYGPETIHFFLRVGWGKRSKLLGLRTVFTLCTPSSHTRTLQMDV